MLEQTTILDEKRDLDTLGGRIGRAREASGLSRGEMAVQLGVTRKTWDNWEADREEPRANRLAMLAGFLNVSPSWLLYGIGEAPNSEDYSELIDTLEERISGIERAHAETADAISHLRAIVSRLSSQQRQED